eukprot:4457711-Pleurochrysis_carterae.AAC.1
MGWEGDCRHENISCRKAFAPFGQLNGALHHKSRWWKHVSTEDACRGLCSVGLNVDSQERRRFPIASSLHRAARYHLGSIAFGSLILALTQAARMLLELIDRQ